jgi:predicted acyl esterase
VPGPEIGFLQEVVRWWDHWLKGVDTGVMDEPMVRAWMQDAIEPNPSYAERPGRWVAEPSWPSPNIESRRYIFDRYALRADGDVSTHEQWPLALQSPLSVGMFAGKWASYAATPDLPSDQREEDGGALVFETESLDAPVEILGQPELELEVPATTPVAMLAARLSDVAPNGEATRVTYGLLNLTHRDGSEHPQPLEPGKRYRIRIQLNGTVIRRRTQEWFSFGGNDPNSVRGETRTLRRYERDDWRTEVRSRTVLTSTPEEFVITAQLDAFELDDAHGNRRVHSQNWERRVPRNLV